MTARALVLFAVLVLQACGATPTTARPATAPPLVARSDATLPPEYRASLGWVWLPVTIEPARITGRCGEPPGKLVARVEPPRALAAGRWVVAGCLYSEENTFTNVFIELAFPDGQILRTRIADRTPPDREWNYEVLVERSDVAGMKAQLYIVTP